MPRGTVVNARAGGRAGKEVEPKSTKPKARVSLKKSDGSVPDSKKKRSTSRNVANENLDISTKRLLLTALQKISVALSEDEPARNARAPSTRNSRGQSTRNTRAPSTRNTRAPRIARAGPKTQRIIPRRGPKTAAKPRGILKKTADVSAPFFGGARRARQPTAKKVVKPRIGAKTVRKTMKKAARVKGPSVAAAGSSSKRGRPPTNPSLLGHTARKKSGSKGSRKNASNASRESFKDMLSGKHIKRNQSDESLDVLESKPKRGVQFAVSEKSESSQASSSGKRAQKRAIFKRICTMTIQNPQVETSLERYSIDDLRRVVQKQIELNILDANTIESYLEGDNQEDEEKLLCMMDQSIQWTKYRIKNQDFDFPHFMRNPVYLASGGFGTVVKCFRYGKPVAVKKVAIPEEDDWEMALRLLREIVILKQAKKVKQRHVSKIIDIFGDRHAKTPDELKSIFIVMPLYIPGSLEYFEVEDLQTFKIIAGHTVNALHFLHAHKIMHRDIKKENIFYHAATQKAYLADLGQARRFQEKGMSGNGEIGTRCYLAPEIMQGKDYDYTADVYSLGQSWYEMLCLSDNKTLFPYSQSGGKRHIEMARTLDEYAVKKREGRLTQEDINSMSFAHSRWELCYEKKDLWRDENIVHILEQSLKFLPTERADTTTLLTDPFFREFRTEIIKVDLREVESDDYDEIKQRIFDLQHGSCHISGEHECGGGVLSGLFGGAKQPASRKRPIRRMCSLAVQYFDK